MKLRAPALSAALSALAIGLLAAGAQGVSAQTFPVRPLRLIVPVPPGAGADRTARTYALSMSAGLGQQVVVDNRGGAAGIIAMEAVAKAPADGYTMIQATIATVCIMPFAYRKLPYDALRDFAPVSLMSLNPLVLVVHPSLPARSVKELIAYAKAKPGRLSYASVGSGSVQHLTGHLFAAEAGIEAVHVPYKGAAPATVDLLSGQVDAAFSGIGTVSGHVAAGRLRAIAVTGKRVDVFPDVPTMQEAGGPDVQMSLWNGMLVPARTPMSVIRRLNAEVVKAANSPELRAALLPHGSGPTSSTPEEFSDMILKEQARMAKVVKASGVRID
jgi:tripartite-type tricarboxylate transporter receptor subunit TctC